MSTINDLIAQLEMNYYTRLILLITELSALVIGLRKFKTLDTVRIFVWYIAFDLSLYISSILIDTLITGKPDFILQIRNSNYITIDSMTFEAHASSTKGFVVSMGACNYNTIKNCKIIGDQSGTGTTFGGIIISGSTTSYTTATTAKYNKILNNDISGGYFGIVAYGSTTVANMLGNEIKNNIIEWR